MEGFRRPFSVGPCGRWSRGWRLRAATVAGALLAVWATFIVDACAAVREDFEGVSPFWQVDAADVRYQVDFHDLVREQPHGGASCERITISSGMGSYVYVRFDVGQARVIEELRGGVWVRSDRPGLQLLARVVLPRSLHPTTKQPITLLLRGAGYTQTNQWQQLKIEDLPRQLQPALRAARLQYGRQLDASEAYVDALLLNVYGGRGVTNVWLDDLELAGTVERDQVQAAPRGSGIDAGRPTGPGALVGSRGGVADRARGAEPKIEMQGAVLLVNGRAHFPRVLEYRGEPLATVRRLGFTAVWLHGEAPADLREEARAAGVWLIAAPPTSLPVEFDASYDSLLAWNLGGRLTGDVADALDRRAQQVRAVDHRVQRPLVIQADTDIATLGRYAQAVVLARDVLGTTLELADYSRWLLGQSRLTPTNTVCWAQVDSQPPPAVVKQIAALANRPPDAGSFDPQLIRTAAWTAAASGMRGLVIGSRTRLDAPDSVTRQRALALQRFNLELSLLETWLAEGQPGGALRDEKQALTTTAVIGRQGRLLLPLRLPASSQWVPPPLVTQGQTLFVPGAPEDDIPYEVSLAGVARLPHRRTAGGMTCTHDAAPPAAQILTTQNAAVVTTLNRQIEPLRRRAAEMELVLARDQIAAAEIVRQQLPTLAPPANDRRAPPVTPADGYLGQARGWLQQSERYLAVRDYASAYRTARRAQFEVGHFQRATWDDAAKLLPSPVTFPAAVSFATLPTFYQHAEPLRRSVEQQLLPNQLLGGDCEELAGMLAAGWRHFRRPSKDVTTHVELSPTAKAAGQSSLHLVASPIDPKQEPQVVDSPPVWVTSAPAVVRSGTVVRISGFVYLPQPARGSVDGLMVIDSIGGPALAWRARPSAQWQPFALFRAVTTEEPVTVTFALGGLGEAWVDQVAVEPVFVLRRGSPTATVPGAKSSLPQPAPETISPGPPAKEVGRTREERPGPLDVEEVPTRPEPQSQPQPSPAPETMEHDASPAGDRFPPPDLPPLVPPQSNRAPPPPASTPPQ